jgi:hypothetical protein
MSMLITDLPYLETISANNSIAGAAGTMVLATASAFGSSPYANSRTNARTIALPRGGSLAIGRGFAIAIGDTPTADVTLAGSGDIVVSSTRDRTFKNVDIARGIVVAIDLPNPR